ncbi:MAG: hypothetical protein HQ518_26965 [Rhodopirellula sp.]|nr:hypothetical protein [Rhodopirellula sp.]
MRLPTITRFSLILLLGATCGFASDTVVDSPFPGARPLPEDFVEPLFPGISAADAEIHKKLNEKTSVNFDKQPLAEALNSISKASELPIILDLISLEDAGLYADSPVTFQISNVPARSILRMILEEFEMNFVVEDAVVKVTTFEGCNRKLETGIFPVADLVTSDRKSWKKLAQLIQGETDGLWERIDGCGGTVSMSHATKSLIVRQTPEVLMDVQQLLTFIRAAKRIGEQRVNPPAPPKEPDGFGRKKGRRRGGLGSGLSGGNFF